MDHTSVTDELHAWVRLSLEPGLGPVKARELLATIGLPPAIYASSLASLERLIPSPLARQLTQAPKPETLELIEKTLAWAKQPGHHIVTLADSGYPAALLAIHDPPLVLYANGHLDCLKQPTLAIVGARSATAGGIDNAKAFAHYLAAHGWCIVSGLASGIDTAAHQGAISGGTNNMRTIAVLGTGIDLVYPAANRALAHQIVSCGLLITEYPLGSRAKRHQFPRRNRIIAGLSEGVLVVEAAKQSGSLITAQMATEMGREVFAIPGSIHSPMSRGCHALIRQGAKLVESGQDIHEELDKPSKLLVNKPTTTQPEAPKAARSDTKASPDIGTASDVETSPDVETVSDVEASPLKQTVLEQLAYDPTPIDLLAQRSQLDIATLNAVLTQLELSDLVERLADGRYQRRPASN